MIENSAFSIELSILRKGLKMGLVGLALLGIVVGAAGTEFLRATRPEIIEKVEDAARRFVDSLCSSKSDNGEAKEK